MAAHPVAVNYGLVAGDFVFVRYNYAQRLWHERLVVLLVDNAGYLVSIVTPDADEYDEDFSGPDIVEVRVAPGAAAGGNPAGIGADPL